MGDTTYLLKNGVTHTYHKQKTKGAMTAGASATINAALGQLLNSAYSQIDTLKNYAQKASDALNKIKSRFSDKEHKEYKDALDDVIAHSDFGTFIDAKFLDNVFDEHFKTQMEVGHSRGTLDPKVRKEASEKMFGTSLSTANDKYEKYGTLVGTDNKDAFSSGAGRYGNVLVRFKKDRVIGRTSITLGDSLGPALYSGLTPDLITSKGAIGIGGNRPDISSFMRNYKTAKADGRINAGQTTLIHGTHSYWEAQYHGDLTKKDVSSLTVSFRGKMSPAQVKRWEDYGIPVYKFDGKTTTRYKGE